MVVETFVKKWGNSFAVILPSQFIKEKHLKEDEKVVIEVVKEADLRKLFGKVKIGSAQKLKDIVRKGWVY